MKLSQICLFALMMHLPVALHAADIVLIVNPASGVERITRDQAIGIFMGRYRKLPSGIDAFPIDIAGQSRERARFYALLVGLDLQKIDAYWARLIFSGQTSPPYKVPNGPAVVQLVAANPKAIGYVDRAHATHGVRVLDLFAGQDP